MQQPELPLELNEDELFKTYKALPALVKSMSYSSALAGSATRRCLEIVTRLRLESQGENNNRRQCHG